MNESNARNQAEAQMRSIREMVSALELDWDRLIDLRDQMEAGTLEGRDREELAELTAAAGDCADRDDEYAHSAEDDLHRDFIRAVIAANLGEMSEVAAEVLKTEEIEFCRWCA